MLAKDLIKILEKNPELEVCCQIDDGLYTGDFNINIKERVYDASDIWRVGSNTYYDGSETKDVRSFDDPKTIIVLDIGFSQ